MRWTIVELAASETYPLRRTILRAGTSSDAVTFDGDDDPATFHLGATIDGSLVAISTWVARPVAGHPSASAVQLRGMATTLEARGSGVSSALLIAGLKRCRDGGGELAWARARTAALSFYERHGFVTSGESYLDGTTGLPHQDIVMRLH